MIDRVVEHFREAELPDLVHVLRQRPENLRDGSPCSVLGECRIQCMAFVPLKQRRELISAPGRAARRLDGTLLKQVAQVRIGRLPEHLEVLGSEASNVIGMLWQRAQNEFTYQLAARPDSYQVLVVNAGRSVVTLDHAIVNLAADVTRSSAQIERIRQLALKRDPVFGSLARAAAYARAAATRSLRASSIARAAAQAAIRPRARAPRSSSPRQVRVGSAAPGAAAAPRGSPAR